MFTLIFPNANIQQETDKCTFYAYFFKIISSICLLVTYKHFTQNKLVKNQFFYSNFITNPSSVLMPGAFICFFQFKFRK